jgi:uncharacterized protein YbjT (DUF2867 family)
MNPDKLILVTGATGYIGGNLIPRLLEKGCRVRVLAREPGCLSDKPFRSQVEVVEGDLDSPVILDQALQGVSTAYYLVHNMGSGKNYVDRELVSAHNFIQAAGVNGVEHIIYLGGLADPQDNIGLHLRSRINTGNVLRQGLLPVTEFRASLIIGSGSISFELIRYLTEQIPILFGPQWIYNRTQPVAVQNVLEYLIAALDNPDCLGKIYEIGGKDILTYAEVIFIYARLRGLKRRIFVLPGMSVNLMGQMAGIFTPIPAKIARPLLGGMRSDSVVQTDTARLDFPNVHPLSFDKSISVALENLSPGNFESIWENTESEFRVKREGFFVEGQRVRSPVAPGSAWRAITTLGGRRGWLYMDWLWKFRGLLDSAVGGPGLRGRKKDAPLIEGDVLDYYRVEVLEPGQRMRLKSELKAPGGGWMEWRIKEQPEGDVLITQVAYFAPHGSLGFLYWYILLPVHHLVFTGLLRAINRQANEIQSGQ